MSFLVCSVVSTLDNGLRRKGLKSDQEITVFPVEKNISVDGTNYGFGQAMEPLQEQGVSTYRQLATEDDSIAGGSM